MAHLAQLNIARSKFSKDEPGMKDFVDALDPVNHTADRTPGFVWRLISDQFDSPALEEFERQGWLVNMSVWESFEDFRSFFTTGLHLSIMRRRAEWFYKSEQATSVLWWVPEGHIPTFEEAMSRLQLLRENGPSQQAFGFSSGFQPPTGL